MNALRELCAQPENLALDDRGRTVILADRVQLAIARTDALIDRLVQDLATAVGAPVSVVRQRYGLGDPGAGKAPEKGGNGL